MMMIGDITENDINLKFILKYKYYDKLIIIKL